MKYIVTVITDKQRHSKHTETTVAEAWQFMLDIACALSYGDSIAKVEKVEFVEENE